MTIATLFQWVEFNQDIPSSSVKKGDRGVIVDLLNPTQQQQEAGYTIEVFQDGDTLDVVSVPISWVTLLPETWGKSRVSSLVE